MSDKNPDFGFDIDPKEKINADITLMNKKVSIRKLWRYATGKDLLLVFLGATIAIMTGSGMPLMSIIVGNISTSFIKMTRRLANPDTLVCDNCNETYAEAYTDEQFHNEVLKQCAYYAVLGSLVYVAAFVQVSCFLTSGEQVIHKMRLAFFRGLLHQDITWFDKNNSGTLTTKLFDNLERVKEGTGDKVGLLIQFTSQFVAGFVIAFTYDWKLTLIMASLSPLLVVSGLFMAKFMESAAASEAVQYAKAGSFAEQALGSIRTVVAFNGQEHECQKYEEALNSCKSEGVRKNIYVGIALASTFAIIFASYSLSFWVGTGFVANGNMEAKTVLTVFFSVLMGSVALGQAGQQFAVIGTAQGAASAIFEIIDRVPEIDSYSTEGQKPQNIQGRITVENLEFAYPTRKEIVVCKGVSFTAEPGQTVALVGSSGCGKSTIIQLLLRYYSPDSGKILIDGIDIGDMNIEYLRKLIAVVSQEPILFNCSIEENILYGSENITYSEMVEACKMANAEGFISKLPQGYKTIVGDRGTQLSGGQKQRIAIARALIRNPKILLLDEATSALDSESESVVQAALDKARQGRTTVIIAHRLSTIKNADKIISMKNGKILEFGNHEELIKKKGLYFELVNSQAFADIDEKPEKFENEIIKDPHPQSRSRSSTATSARRLSLAFSIDTGLQNMEDDEKSVTKRLLRDLEAEGGKEEDLLTIVKHARPWWFILSIAVIASVINGIVFPAFSIFFSEIMTIFSTPDVHKMKKDGRFWSIMLLGCGVVQGITAFVQSALFGYVSEQLTTKLRSDLFRNVMRMNIGYFDKDNHSSGKISTRLATDTPNVKSAIDYRLGTVIAALISIICGLVISFYYSWPMALLVIGIFPLGIIGRALQLRYLKGSTEKDARDMESAGNIALQGIENVRTVQALTLEKKFYNMFEKCLESPHKSAKKDAIIQGITYGFSTSILYFIFAAAFRFALWLILYQSTQPMDVMKVLMAISFSMGNIGFAAAYFPEYKKARLAAGIIFKMLGEVPEIDSFSEDGIKKEISGEVHFKNLWFSYPQRRDVQILKGLDIAVKPGQTLALVGPSGCGKSTCISLLERFYDPLNGEIEIDGIDLKKLNIKNVRSKMALVSQEPILFDFSIKENLLYGLDPENISENDIIQAAKLSNIHKFVTSLPEGYSTRVGEKGTQLSGGQKQRIAIARALIRNPKILLLDEATSALDSESEKIVQEALDKAREGRTCIIIAHRLSTVVNADCIAVCNNGVIVEQGTHGELMIRKGAYYNLTQKQLRAKTD